MIIVTNQMLYTAFHAEFSEVDVTKETAEEVYDDVIAELSDQEGFSDDLSTEIASIAFDAVNDCYFESQGLTSQTNFSDEAPVELFSVEAQEAFATWVGRKAAHIAGALKGVGQGAKYIGRQGAYKTNVGAGGSRYERSAFDQGEGKAGFKGRVMAGYRSHLGKKRAEDFEKRRTKALDNKALRAANEAQDKKEDERAARKRRKSESPSFFDKFKDSKEGFIGIKGGREGVKDWAKKNKAQAATLGAGAAAVGVGGYMAYKAAKKAKEAKKAEEARANMAPTNQQPINIKVG